MIPYLWVALGSALGGVARYGFSLMAGRLWGDSFPWGTIAINVLGSFVIGFFGALTVPDGAMPANPNLRIFVMVGICGGFTTFSSFSLQTLNLARDGSWFGAMANVLLSVTVCLLAVTLGQAAAGRIGALRSEAPTMSHSILAILDRPQTEPAVLAAAALVAQRVGDARIEALHLRHDSLEGFMPSEEVMTRQRREEFEAAVAGKSAEMHGIFAAWRQASGIGEWREVIGEAGKVIAAAAAHADLTVIGHGPGRYQGDTREAIHVALFDAKLATLLVPETVPASLGRNVAVAWKPGEAADRAIDAALPLLLRAERVIVLMETEDGNQDAEPAGRLQRLRQGGVPVMVHRFEAGGRKIGDALIEEAHGVDADLLVMGAYTHSRLAEFVLGGATRDVLASADLPVLMRH
jgi:protein CrcB